MKTQLFVFATICLSLIGCRSTGFQESQVLERILGEDETPEWTAAKKTVETDKENFYFIHAVSTGNKRPEVCVKIAEEGARGDLLRYINERLTHSGQSNEGGENDPSMESLTTWLAKGKLTGITVKDRYWEKAVESVSATEQVIKVRCAARIQISRSSLEQQIREAQGLAGNEKIRAAQEKAVEKFIADEE